MRQCAMAAFWPHLVSFSCLLYSSESVYDFKAKIYLSSDEIHLWNRFGKVSHDRFFFCVIFRFNGGSVEDPIRSVEDFVSPLLETYRLSFLIIMMAGAFII